jgi:hypothetical protein
MHQKNNLRKAVLLVAAALVIAAIAPVLLESFRERTKNSSHQRARSEEFRNRLDSAWETEHEHLFANGPKEAIRKAVMQCQSMESYASVNDSEVVAIVLFGVRKDGVFRGVVAPQTLLGSVEPFSPFIVDDNKNELVEIIDLETDSVLSMNALGKLVWLKRDRKGM